MISINDAEYNFYRGMGLNGALNDMRYQYGRGQPSYEFLTGKGYDGALNDMRLDYYTKSTGVPSLFLDGEQGAWYDPADLSTLFQDSAGTTPVTAVEQAVALMLDKSGNGNHATQATSTKRPRYSRRVNLLTKTEQFNDAAWAKARCSVTSNAAVGPDGLMSAEKVIADAQLNPHFLSATTAHKSGATYRISVYAKAGEWDSVLLFGANNAIGGLFDLSLGTYVSDVIGVPIAPTITPVGGGWYLLAMSFVTTADDQTVSIRITPSGGSSGAPGNWVAGLYLWGASLTLATDAHLPYQRVNTATDYDADPAKFPAYLRLDGVDDALQTGNIDFTGTDKMTVWAGVTTLLVVDQMRIVELGPSADIYPGFGVVGGVATSARIRGELFGTSRGVVDSPAYPYPANTVASVQYDIGASALLDEIKIRANGVVVNSPTLNSAGTGTFPNAAINIGARAGTSLYFNGRLYSLIVRGAQSSLSQIEAVENLIRKTMRLP